MIPLEAAPPGKSAGLAAAVRRLLFCWCVFTPIMHAVGKPSKNIPPGSNMLVIFEGIRNTCWAGAGELWLHRIYIV